MATLFDPTFLEGELFKVVLKTGSDTEPIEFHLHKQLLSTLSPYFRALPNFSEGKCNTVEFDEMCPRAFRYVVMWMYSKVFHPTAKAEDGDLLIRAWAIADRLMMTECKNLIMQQIQQYFRTHLVRNSNFLQVELLGLSTTQAVSRFLKDQFTHQSRSDNVQLQALIKDLSGLLDSNTDLSKSTILSVVSELKSSLRDPSNIGVARISPTLKMDGTYHEHPNDDVCDLPACSRHSTNPEPTQELLAWDHGLGLKERRRKEKEMKLDGTWETRVTQGMIDEGIAVDGNIVYESNPLQYDD